MECLLCHAEEMAERGRHREERDVYESRDKDYSHSGDHATYDTRGRNKKPRDMDKRGSASDMEPPANRNHNHEGPSRL